MTEKFIIALDQGTSSCRACAVDGQGVVRAQKTQTFSPQRDGKLISQYSAQDLLSAQREVLNSLLEEITPQRVAAIGVCSQRSTVVLWDKQTGDVLAPVLTWEDGRAQAQAQAADLSQEQVHQLTGLFKTPYFSAPKIAWCLQHEPAARQAARQHTLLAAPVASYLIWHLTGRTVFATDPTLAQRTLLWSMESGQWSPALCQAFGVPIECLPTLQPTVADYGNYLYKGVKLPILVCAADQQAAAAYHELAAGKTLINYGTGAFVLHHTGRQLAVLPGMLSSVAASTSLQDRQFLLEGPVFAAGSVLSWLQSRGIDFEIAHLDALCARAGHPVQLLPALGGLGAPYWDYTVKPCTQQVTPQTTAADWVAGALRGIAGLVADIVYYLRAHAQPVGPSVLVSGGLSRSHYLLTQQADLLGVPLSAQDQPESTILGTARLAAGQLGWDTSAWQTAPARQVVPRLTAQQTQAAYRRWAEFVAQCRTK